MRFTVNINQHFLNLAQAEGANASQLITQRERLFKDKVMPELIKRKANETAILDARSKWFKQTDQVMIGAGLLPKDGQSSQSFKKDQRAERAVNEATKTGSKLPIIKESVRTFGDNVGNMFSQGVGSTIEGLAGFVRDIGENETDSIAANTAKYGQKVRKGYENSASTFQKGLQAGESGKAAQLASGAIQSVPAMALPFGAAKGLSAVASKIPLIASKAPYVGLAGGLVAGHTQNYGEVRRNATANLQRDFPTWEKLQGNPTYEKNFQQIFDSGVGVNQARKQAHAKTLDDLSEGAADKYGTAMTAIDFIAPSGATLGSGILKNLPNSKIGKALVGGGVSADLVRREINQAPRMGIAKLIPDIGKTANIAAAKMVGKQALEEGLQGGIGEYGAQAATANIGGKAVDWKSVGKTILEEGAIGGIMGGGMQSASGGSATSQAKDIASNLRNQTNRLRQEEAAARQELASATEYNNPEQIQSAQANLQNIGAEANKVKQAYQQYGIDVPHFVDRFSNQYTPQEQQQQEEVIDPEAIPATEDQPQPAPAPAPAPAPVNQGMADTTNIVMDSVTKGILTPEEAQAIQSDPIHADVFSLATKGDEVAAYNVVMNAVSLGNLSADQAQTLIEAIPRYKKGQKSTVSSIVDNHVKQQVQPTPLDDGGEFSNAIDLDPNTLEPIDPSQPSLLQDDISQPQQFTDQTKAYDYLNSNGLQDSHEMSMLQDGTIDVRPRKNTIPDDPNLNDFGYNPKNNLQQISEDPNLTEFSEGAVSVGESIDENIPDIIQAHEEIIEPAQPIAPIKPDHSKAKHFSNSVKANLYLTENNLKDSHEIKKLEDGRVKVQLKSTVEAPIATETPDSNLTFPEMFRDAHLNNPSKKPRLINDEIDKGRLRSDVLKEASEIVKSIGNQTQSIEPVDKPALEVIPEPKIEAPKISEPVKTPEVITENKPKEQKLINNGMLENDIGRLSDNQPFANKPAANNALKTQKIESTHEVLKLAPSQFILREKQDEPKATDTDNALAKAKKELAEMQQKSDSMRIGDANLENKITQYEELVKTLEKEQGVEQPNKAFDDVAKQYGKSVKADGSILRSDGRNTGVKVATLKNGRVVTHDSNGKQLFTGTKEPESLGNFFESYWFDKKKAQPKAAEKNNDVVAQALNELKAIRGKNVDFDDMDAAATHYQNERDALLKVADIIDDQPSKEYYRKDAEKANKLAMQVEESKRKHNPEANNLPVKSQESKPAPASLNIQANDEIIFNKDFDYAEAGKNYTVKSVTSAKIVIQGEDGAQLSLPTKTLSTEIAKNPDLMAITKPSSVIEVKEATPPAKQVDNDVQKLDQTSGKTLEAIPSEDVRGVRQQGDSTKETGTSGRADLQGSGRAGIAGDDTGRSVADGEREVPVSARGKDSNNGLDPKQAIVADNAPVDAFVIDETDIAKGGKKTKFKANIEAIKIIKLLELEGRPATKAEQKSLSKFVGWGGLAEAFKREDGSISTGWTKEVAELESLLTAKEMEAAVDSSIAAHYTSPEIVKALWKALENFGFKSGRVLEPAVGVGNFFGLMPKNMRKASNLYAVELDNITGAVAKNLYPEANIKAPMGFQDYQTVDGFFDIAIGNPPFSSISINDRVRSGINGFSLHNYFFAKSVDSLKPNGVLAMVVTNRFLDKMGDKERAYISERAELVGAIRLPNDAFLSNAGTQVTTDIIFLRKKAEGETNQGEAWLDVKNYTDKDGNSVPLNEYFIKNPQNMLGDFGAYGSMYREGEPALIKRDNQNTEQLLNEVIEKLPKDVFKAESSQNFEETRKAVIRDIGEVKVGSKFINSDGTVHERLPDIMGDQKSQMVEFSSEKVKDRVVRMIQTAEKLSSLRTLQLDPNATDKQIATARKELNTEYDAFVKENGFINSDTNKRLMRDDPNWAQLSALENKYDRGVSAAVAKSSGQVFRKPNAEKAAIFSKRTQTPMALVESVSSASDALTESLNRHGHVNVKTMQQLYAGKSESEIIAELGETIFEDPIDGYVVRDEYLSGNVKQKLAIAKEKAQQDLKYERNVRALEKVIPADIEALDIDVKIGSHWIPNNYIADFVSFVTGSKEAQANYSRITNKWDIVPSGVTATAMATFATARSDTKSILSHAVNGTKPTIYDTFSDGTSVINQEATLEAAQRVELVKSTWKDWIWENDARRDHLERIYNDVFNTTVNRDFDGSHLVFHGMNKGIQLRPHQQNAVWRSVQSKATLYDHTVGAGKTFTVIAAAMEMRRMGIVNKPLIVVPNHLVGQWANDFVLLYPNANILAATKKDFEKSNRKRFIAKMANGDYDAIIIAHSSFGKISISPEQEQSFIDNEIADLMSFEAELKASNNTRTRNAKDVAKRRLALEEKKKNLLNRDNKDTDNIYWHELGIDSVMLDEAHEFKNLEFTTSMQNVAGLGTGKGSQKAKDLFAKIQIMQGNNPKSKLIFATGTPISNTMAEMFTMQRYLDWNGLKEQGINHFDAWARVFGEVVSDWELSPSGKYKLTNRFAKFVNMPELMQGYLGFSDVMNRDDINAQLAKEGKTLGTPKIKGDKPQNIIVERSDDQADYIGMPSIDSNGNEEYPEGSLVWRTENLPRKPEKGADNMLKIMGDARKAALDMRLIDPEAPDYSGSKVNVAADSIYATYKKWNAKKGAQLVFCDLSTPKGAVAAEKVRIEELVKQADDGNETAQAELDKLSPDELSALDSSFSVYDDLKAKLIAKGMAASEVVFIHDAKTELQMQELFEKVKRGDIRILMGSTAKMGAGMNVQNKLVALHHLDAPWRPSDLEQREGRIIRQDNEFYKADPNGFEIEINRYATKQTLDSRMWQTIESKAKFIEQVRKGAGTTRIVEDIAGEAANAAEMKAASSGDPRILEEMDLRKQIKALEDDKRNFDRGIHRTKNILKSTENEISLYTRKIEALKKDLEIKQPEKFAYSNGKTKIFQEDKGARDEIGKIFEAGIKNAMAKGREEYLGEINGFKISAMPSTYIGGADINIQGNNDAEKLTRFDIGNSSLGLVQRILNHIKSLSDELKAYQESLKQSQDQIEPLNKKVNGAVWDKGQELSDLKDSHSALIEELKPKKKEVEENQKVDPATDKKLSRRDDTGKGSTPAQVRTQLVNRFGDDVIQQLEQKGILTIAATHSEQGIEGFAENGRVTLVADAITAENIIPVFLHELGGHIGMQGVMKPAAYQVLMKEFNRLVKSGNTEALEAKRLAERETNAEVQADEYLPYLITVAAQNQAKQGPVQRLISRVLGAVKAWAVDKLGLNLKLNPSDILALAKRMVKTVAKNPPPTPPKGKLKTDQTETEAFKKWFGDSKVIDESGKPKIVYHGTNQSFNIFNVSDVGIHAGTMDQAQSRKEEKSAGQFNVMPLYMRINNPLRLKDSPSWKDPAFYIQKTGIAQYLSAPLVKRITGFYDELKGIDLKSAQGQEQALELAMGINRRVTKELKAQGYDGIVYKNTHDGTSLENKMREDDAWIVFDPEQIKSAINNNGDFDSSNPDIRYSRTDNPENDSRSRQREFLDSAAKSAFGQMSLRGAEGAKTLSKRTLNLFQTMLHKSLNDKSGEFKRTFDLVQNKINHVTFASSKSMDVAPNVLTQLEAGSDYWKEAKRVGRTLGHSLPFSKIEKAKIDTDLEKVGKLMFENTLLEDSERHTDKELRKLGFDEDQIKIYNEIREAIDTSLDTFANTTFSNIYKHLGGTDKDILDLAAKDLDIHDHYNAILKLIDNLTKDVPEKTDARQAAIEAIDKVLKKANDLKDNGYVPLMRFGKYFVRIFNPATGEVAYRQHFESESERNIFFNNYNKESLPAGYEIEQSQINELEHKLFQGVSPETVALFAKESGLPIGDAETAYIKYAVKNNHALKRLLRRQGIDGFDSDVKRVLASFVLSNARYSANQIYNPAIDESITDIKDPAYQEDAIRLRDYALDTQEELAPIKNFAFVYYMGFSAMFGLVNLTQPILQTLPYLMQYSTDHATIPKAFLKAIQTWRKGTDTMDQVYKADYERARKEGHLDPQNTWMMQGLERGKSGLGASTWQLISHSSGLFAQASETVNRRTTLFAALDVAKSLGQEKLEKLGFKDSYDFAVRAIQETQGIYNKGNRPRVARGNIGSVLMMYKQFMISYIEQMSRMQKSGLYGGEDDQFKKKMAKLVGFGISRSVLVALGVLMSFSGATGLPFMRDILDAIETTGGLIGKPINTEREVQIALHDALGQTLGSAVNTALMDGFVNLNPVMDVKGRMGMGDLIPATAYFSPTTSEYMKSSELSNIAGPMGGLLEKLKESVALAQVGAYGQAGVQLLPKAATSLGQGVIAATTGDYRNMKTGVKTNDATVLDGIIKTLDAQPATIAKEGRVRGLEMKDKAAQAYNNKRWREGYEKALESGDRMSIRDIQQKIVEYNKDDPRYPVNFNQKTAETNFKKSNQNWQEKRKNKKGLEWMDEYNEFI